MKKCIITPLILVLLGLCFASSTAVFAALPGLKIKIPGIDFNSPQSTATPQAGGKKDVSYKRELPANYRWGVKIKKNYKLYDSNGVQHGDSQTFAANELKEKNKKPTYIKELTAKYRNSILKKKKVTLTWKYTGKNKVKYYLIYRRINQGDWTQIGKVVSGRFEDENISIFGIYDYRVTAFYINNTTKNTGDFSSEEISLEVEKSRFSLF